jgi:hypothetical protein
VTKQPGELGPIGVQGPPSGFYVIVPPRKEDKRIDVARGVRILWRSWLPLLAASLCGALLVGLMAFNLRNVYRGQALIFPVVDNGMNAQGAIGDQLGGLASLVGVDLGTRAGSKEEAYATLNSPGLKRDFISAHDLLPVLFFDRWDAAKHAWRTGKRVPSLDDGVEYFKDVCSITQDRRTGVITVRVDWYDNQQAAQWANDFVGLANQRLRDAATVVAQRNIDFLQQEAAKTDNVGLRQAIYRLMESQIRDAMVASVEREYAFHTVDPALPSDLKHKVAPHRTLMVLEGAVGVGTLLSAWILWRRRSEWIV